MKPRRPANSRVRGGSGSGGRLDKFLPEMKAYLEIEDGFIAFYESIPTDGEWSEEEFKSSSDEMRVFFRQMLKEKRQRTIRRR